MLSFLHLKPFYIYNIILIISFSLIVSSNQEFPYLYISLYCIFHFLLIYLALYHFRITLYFIYFFYGLGLDILWLNEIGPHLLVFVFILVIIKFTQKYLYKLSSLKIYFFLLLAQLSMIFLEKIFSYILFSFKSDSILLIKIIIFSIILSFPIFFLFSKIDELK